MVSRGSKPVMEATIEGAKKTWLLTLLLLFLQPFTSSGRPIPQHTNSAIVLGLGRKMLEESTMMEHNHAMNINEKEKQIEVPLLPEIASAPAESKLAGGLEDDLKDWGEWVLVLLSVIGGVSGITAMCFTCYCCNKTTLQPAPPSPVSAPPPPTSTWTTLSIKITAYWPLWFWSKRNNLGCQCCHPGGR